MCSSAAVERLPSARIRRGSQSAPEERPPTTAAPKQASVAKRSTMSLASFVHHVLQNTEDVGPRFPDEARKIHYEEGAAPRDPRDSEPR